MKIHYPTTQAWRKYLTPEKTVFTGTKQKRLRKVLEEAEKLDIQYEISPLSDDFFSWFTPMYEANLQKKKNATVYDVADITYHNKTKSYDYYGIKVTIGGEVVAGTVFSDRATGMFIGYKVAAPDWGEAKLQLSPSLFGEHVAFQWAQQHNKEYISMGKDQNPYGPNADIGLAEYKLATGYQPKVSKTYESATLDTTEVTEDTLVLLPPEEGSVFITKAYLILTGDSNPADYKRLLSYPDTLQITPISTTGDTLENA